MEDQLKGWEQHRALWCLGKVHAAPHHSPGLLTGNQQQLLRRERADRFQLSSCPDAHHVGMLGCPHEPRRLHQRRLKLYPTLVLQWCNHQRQLASGMRVYPHTRTRIRHSFVRATICCECIVARSQHHQDNCNPRGKAHRDGAFHVCRGVDEVSPCSHNRTAGIWLPARQSTRLPRTHQGKSGVAHACSRQASPAGQLPWSPCKCSRAPRLRAGLAQVAS